MERILFFVVFLLLTITDIPSGYIMNRALGDASRVTLQNGEPKGSQISFDKNKSPDNKGIIVQKNEGRLYDTPSLTDVQQKFQEAQKQCAKYSFAIKQPPTPLKRSRVSSLNPFFSSKKDTEKKTKKDLELYKDILQFDEFRNKEEFQIRQKLKTIDPKNQKDINKLYDEAKLYNKNCKDIGTNLLKKANLPLPGSYNSVGF